MTNIGWAVTGTASLANTGMIITRVAFVSTDKNAVEGVYERLSLIQYDCQDDPIGTAAIRAVVESDEYKITYNISKTIINV